MLVVMGVMARLIRGQDLADTTTMGLLLMFREEVKQSIFKASSLQHEIRYSEVLFGASPSTYDT